VKGGGLMETAKKEPRVIKTRIVLKFDVWYRQGETVQSDIRQKMRNEILGKPLPTGVTNINIIDNKRR
jgi:hypothetical protein